MIKSARVSIAKNSYIIELPKDKTFIVIKEDPFILIARKFGWINPSEHRHEQMIRNWHGTYQENEENFIPLVSPEKLHSAPEKDFSFYGVINHIDVATFSDLIKDKDIVRMGAKMQTLEGSLIVTGRDLKYHEGYYHSHPVQNISLVDIYKKLEQICKSDNISNSKKFDEVSSCFSSSLNIF